MTARDMITRFIAEEFLPDTKVEDIPDNLDLIEAGIIDSLGVFKIIAYLESELNVTIDVEDMVPGRFRSVQAIYELVNGKTA